MTDLELLGRAASAAMLAPPTIDAPWNPLLDDGQALRLAVLLDIYVFFEAAKVFARRGDGRKYRSVGELRGADSRSATRRAIVRAAAQTEREASHG